MKSLVSMIFAVGLMFSTAGFAGTDMKGHTDTAKPADKVKLQIKAPDGTTAEVMVDKKKSNSFHKAKGVEACVMAILGGC